MTTTAKRKGLDGCTRESLTSNHPLKEADRKIMTHTPDNEPNVDEIAVKCERAHCDAQGGTHVLEMSAYEDLEEAHECVPHSIDLGGVFGVDCSGGGPWTFWTNHNEISENEIQWWIEQATAAAKLCMDLNRKSPA